MIRGGFVVLFALILSAGNAHAERVVYESSLIWAGDADRADYSFTADGKLSGARLTPEGWLTVADSAEKDGYYQSLVVTVDDSVTAVTVNYEAEGAVSVAVSGDKGRTWRDLVNGVPQSGFKDGGVLVWKAVLTPGSVLKRVVLDYETAQGKRTGFGSPELSGCTLRKQIDVTTTAPHSLFNHQVMLLIAADEASGSTYAAHLNGKALASFADIRFTAADGRTVIPHTIERIETVGDVSVARVWVRIPQIPSAGVSLYVYYGNPSAVATDAPHKVFDFYDSFDGERLDSSRWTDADLVTRLSESRLILESGELVSAKSIALYGSVIEYRASPIEGKEVRLNLRGADESGRLHEICLFSSTFEGKEHCIAVDGVVRSNTAVPVVPGLEYGYQAELSDIVSFLRFDGEFSHQEADCMQDLPRIRQGQLSFNAADSVRLELDWVRVRRYTIYDVKVSGAPEYEAEPVEPAVFVNTELDSQGRVTLIADRKTGSFRLPAVKPDTTTRLALPEAAVQGAVSLILDAGDHTYVPASGAQLFLKTETKPIALRLSCELTSGVVPPVVERLGLEHKTGTLTLIEPNGGEQLNAGTTCTVRWSADDYLPDELFVLDYSSDGGATWQEVAEVNNSGSFKWQVPADTAEKALLVIRLAGHTDIGDMCDGPFGITENKNIAGADRPVRRLTELPKQEAMSSAQDNLTSGEVSAVRDALARYQQTVLMPGEQVYDVVIVIGDENDPDGLKDGDILSVREGGYGWSDIEREQFLIVPMYLKPSDARELVKPKQLPVIAGDEPSAGFQRKYRISAARLKLPAVKFSELNAAQKKQLRALMKDKVLSRAVVEKK
jgi:hypothetical protein